MIKLLIILIATLILGGCTLTTSQGDAAKDQAPNNTVVMSPEPSLSTDNSESALETDLNATIIEDEDFSDLK